MKNSIDPADHLGLARKAAKVAAMRDSVPVEDTEEYSVATMAIMAAARNFDPSCGVQFSTYAFRWIMGAIIRLSTRRARQNVRMKRIGTNDSLLSLCDIDDPADNAEHSEEITELRLQIRALPYDQRVLVQMRLGGMNLRDICEAMDICEKTARRIENIAMRTLREGMTNRFNAEEEV